MNNHDKIKQAFNALKAPDNMAEKIIINAMGETPKRMRRPYRIGRVAITAVLFILMTVTVLAVAFPALFQIGKLYRSDGWVMSEINQYPISEKFRDYINTAEWKQEEGFYWGMTNYFQLSSLEEAADFFGVQFPSNTMLTKFKELADDTQNIFDRANVTALIAYSKENDNAYVTLFADYMPDNVKIINVRYGFTCGGNKNETVSSALLVGNDIDEESGDVQDYTSPINGIDAVLHKKDTLYKYPNDPEFKTDRYATFALNNISYHITIYYFPLSATEQDNSYDTLKEIINAFEFE